MSVTLNMVGSGGVNVVALIVAYYPIGATCTATCNGITLTADSGTKYVFQIPFLGTWSVTADLNGATQTENFVISAPGAVESVMLYPYTEITYLYDQGNEYTSVTGGWTVNALAGKTTDSLGFNPYGNAYTTNYLSVNNYLAVMVVVKSESAGIFQIGGVTTPIQVPTTTEYKTFYLDVEGISGTLARVSLTCVEGRAYVKTVAFVR